MGESIFVIWMFVTVVSPLFPAFFFLSHHNTLRGASLYLGILDHTQPANREKEGWLDHGFGFFFGCFCFVFSCYFRLAERRCIFFFSLGQFFFSLFSVGKLRIGEEIERGLGTYQPQPVAAGYKVSSVKQGSSSQSQ